jgi:hypothetical protein
MSSFRTSRWSAAVIYFAERGVEILLGTAQYGGACVELFEKGHTSAPAGRSAGLRRHAGGPSRRGLGWPWRLNLGRRHEVTQSKGGVSRSDGC